MKPVISRLNPKAHHRSPANFKRHREVSKIHDANDASQLCEREWVVGAPTLFCDQYTLCLLDIEHAGRYLSCHYCSACLHKFSCLDFHEHSSVCKHIHAVALWQVSQKSPSQSEKYEDRAILSSYASNQPLLDPENNDDLAITSSPTGSKLLQDPESLLKRMETSETLEVLDRHEIGSNKTTLLLCEHFKPIQMTRCSKIAHNTCEWTFEACKTIYR
ncbi:hypothetical protein HPB48_009597 [Haemaphysalis longicornis]|uniref:Uncharacterized protein n=1 Tax=Haemaphysalis longicornis TaxID=44386 RepID=A0A9J6FKK3_HAELO|nr:hypothetical protein HPB48_009597 [Haemaphysalis longicornis]